MICHLLFSIMGLILTFPLVNSFGYNVALNQPTRQSSTYTDNKGITYGSEKAVDGNIIDSEDCTITNLGDPSPWFEVTLPRTDIFSMVIYNRGDNYCCKHRLSYFRLELFDGDTSVFVTNGPDMSNKESITIGFTPTIVASRVNISTRYAEPHDDGAHISICELQIYSDIQFPDKSSSGSFIGIGIGICLVVIGVIAFVVFIVLCIRRRRLAASNKEETTAHIYNKPNERHYLLCHCMTEDRQYITIAD